MTIVLGDIAGIASKTTVIVIGLGLVTSVIALILRFVTGVGSTSGVMRAIGWAGAGLTWLIVIALSLSLAIPEIMATGCLSS
ncbi:MAG: hypothetical protein IPL71_20890 [Anaerolineales bacterium]|uniref:hypothetical protein n=1 Tax=Candidatus Villigracilis proximus TaxID=3140683 RepID=UPI003136BE95|nr:hypothetical protein [Anaerolineales bacterium]